MKKYILEERGHFWWHGKKITKGRFCPESAVGGLIQIDENGHTSILLDEVLSLGKTNNSILRRNSKIFEGRQIQGRFKNRKGYVFIIVAYRAEKFSNGHLKEDYFANICLVGDNSFSGKKTLLFSGLSIELKGYEDWLNLTPIELAIKNKKREISIKYKNPKDLIYSLNDEKIFIKYDFSFKGNYYAASLQTFASLVYTPSNPMSLEDMKSQYLLLQDLFIVLTNSGYNFAWPILFISKKDNCILYFSRYKNSANSVETYKSCIQFGEVCENFGEIFSTWKNKKDTYGPGFYLYLGTRRGMFLYTENIFLNLVFGIESLHRKKYPGAIQAGKLVQKIDRILTKVDGRDKKWLKKKLGYASEVKLAERIYQILEGILSGIDKKQIKDFSEKCAYYRNGISHFGEGRDGKDYSSFHKDLLVVTKALSYLYHIVILREIGIKDELLNYWIHRGILGQVRISLKEAGLNFLEEIT